MAFERKVGKELARRGHPLQDAWFQFHDTKIGRGYAHPDGFIQFKTRTLLVEMKLTGGPHGKQQMEGLYKPILEHVFGLPVKCLLICKWITADTPGPIFNSIEAFLASEESFGTLQWL